jgi:WD40 repeat protein
MQQRDSVTMNHSSSLFKTAIMGLALALSACSAEPPESTNEYATQGIRDGNLNEYGRRAVIASINHGGSLWSTETNDRLFNWNHKQGEYSDLTLTAISRKAEVAITANNGTMVAWNSKTGQPKGFWSAPGVLRGLTIDNSGRYAGLARQDNLANVFDLNAGQIIQTLAHEDMVRSMHFVPGTELVVTGSEDLTAVLWNWRTASKEQVWEFNFPADYVVTDDQATKVFISAYLDNGYIYSLSSGKELAITNTERNRISSARFSSDGKRLLLGRFDGHLQLHNAETGEMLRQWKVHIRPQVYREASHITDVAFGDNNQYLALGSNGLLNRFK